MQIIDMTTQRRSDKPATKKQINGYCQNRNNCLGMTQSFKQQAEACAHGQATYVATNQTSNKQTNGYGQNQEKSNANGNKQTEFAGIKKKRSKPKEHGQNQCKFRGMSQNGGYSQSIKPKPTLARQVPTGKSNIKHESRWRASTKHGQDKKVCKGHKNKKLKANRTSA